MTEKMPERIWAYCYLYACGSGHRYWDDEPIDNNGDCYGITEYILSAPVTAELDKLRGLLREAGVVLLGFVQEHEYCIKGVNANRPGWGYDVLRHDTPEIAVARSTLTRIAAEVPPLPSEVLAMEPEERSRVMREAADRAAEVDGEQPPQ